jgi:hypothetical protein
MAAPKCTGTDKRGDACRWPAWRDGPVCIACAARAGNAEASAEMRDRATKGNKQQAKNKKARQVSEAPMRSTDDLLTALERSMVRVENAGGDAIAKAGAVCKLVSEARAVLKAAELEKENSELRTLLLEKHPELRSHLRAVK